VPGDHHDGHELVGRIRGGSYLHRKVETAHASITQSTKIRSQRFSARIFQASSPLAASSTVGTPKACKDRADKRADVHIVVDDEDSQPVKIVAHPPDDPFYAKSACTPQRAAWIKLSFGVNVSFLHCGGMVEISQAASLIEVLVLPGVELWRLTKKSDEALTHALGVGKPRYARDCFQRFIGVFDQGARGLRAQALDGFGGRLPGLSHKGAAN